MKHPFGMNASELVATKASLRELTIDEAANIGGAKKRNRLDYSTMALGEEGGSSSTSRALGEEGGSTI